MRSRRLLLALPLLALVAPLLRAAADDPRIAVSREVRVAMRDGVRLATDVYRPASEGRPLPGRFPVVLERTPYDREWLAETAAALVREWPLARARETAYYLHAGGALSPERPRPSSPTRYTFDPRDPVPTMGGNISSEDTAGPHGFVKTLMLRGAMDQRCRKTFWLCTDERPLAARNDVLVFETPPLAAPVEITGPITVRLFVSSSAPDTDFTAKLVDVWPPSPGFPAGFAMNVSDGILRMRFRAGGEKEELMEPGKIYPAEILLYPTSLLVPRGHRLRIDVSSSNFPRFDVNPNTGEPLNDNRRWQTAENAVYHDPRHPSAVLLPVVPGSAP